MGAALLLSLEHTDARPRPAGEQLARDREPDDPATDDSEIAAPGVPPRGGRRERH